VTVANLSRAGVILMIAAATQLRAVVQTALVGYLVAACHHLAFHVAHVGSSNPRAAAFLLAGLTALCLIVTGLVWMTIRSSDDATDAAANDQRRQELI
jgi:high-affinity Fe2+/Pb2+ permease